MYQAKDLINDEVVAIKVISLADQPTDEFKQIEKEIDFLASCNHPNIVRYLVGGRGRNTCAGGLGQGGMLNAHHHAYQHDHLLHTHYTA